ncbi:cache domain-containing protein [Sphingomonas sp. I4]
MKNLAALAKSSAASFRDDILGYLQRGSIIAEELAKELEGGRLAELARSIADALARSIYDRSIDVRMLATDHSIIDAILTENTSHNIAVKALGRLRNLLQYSPYFLNAFVVDGSGKVVVCAHENAAVRDVNFSKYPQYQRAMSASVDLDWMTDEVWMNPWSENRKVLIFVAPVRSEGITIGVCYLEFDFQRQAASMMGVINEAATSAVASIIDYQNRVVATTGDTPTTINTRTILTRISR